MKQWAGLGKFLAGHMQIIVPICVALGVLFPQQIGVLKPIVPALFAFMTFQGALSNTFHQVAEVFHRPLHLILALLVSAVLIPIAAYAIGSLFFGSNPNLVLHHARHIDRDGGTQQELKREWNRHRGDNRGRQDDGERERAVAAEHADPHKSGDGHGHAVLEHDAADKVGVGAKEE